jgi:hypothetical protein
MATPGFNNRINIANNLVTPFSGLTSSRPNAKFMSGARCVLKFNGQLVGFAFAISWSVNTSFSEINTIDDYLPSELAPQRISVEGTLSALHVPGVSATTQNWQADINNFLFAPYISIEARDQTTNQIIFATDKAVVLNRTENVTVDQLSSMTLRWRAIGFLDEKVPSSQPANNFDKASFEAKFPASSPQPAAASLNPSNITNNIA